MFIIEKFTGFLANYELGQKYLELAAGLDHSQINLLILITLTLILFIVYRKLGASIFWVVVFVFFLGYIVYRANLGAVYQERSELEEIRSRQIQEELEKG